MIDNIPCKIKTQCSECSKAVENVVSLYVQSKGFYLPATKCEQNYMIFLLKGIMMINSQEYAGTTLDEGQFILQAIGSKLEILAMTNVEFIVYRFNQPYYVCGDRYKNIIEKAEAPLIYSPLNIVKPLQNYLESVAIYVNDQLVCKELMELKQKELNIILNCYYSTRDLYTLYAPISSYTNGFHYFVMQNYSKVKTVEELAHLGGYSITTFRRMFKNMFNEPAYEWMLKQKRVGIMDDLIQKKLSISEISDKYGFDSLPHFSNFCKSCFGNSPRALRKEMAVKQ